MVTGDELRTIALGLPGAEERETWGHPTFRVKDKIFTTMADDGATATVKATRDEQAALIASDPKTFTKADYVGQHGWTVIRLDRVEREEVRELVVDAWRRTAPKRMVTQLDETS